MDPRIAASLQPLHCTPASERREAVSDASGGHFKQLLQTELNQVRKPLKISKHAEQRMEARGITIAPSTWTTISLKIQEAKEKGITDSLVITDAAALVVSAKKSNSDYGVGSRRGWRANLYKY